MMKVSRTARAFIGGAIAILLSGCGGLQSGVTSQPLAANVAPLPGDRGGCPTSRCIAVANETYAPGGYIVFFPRGANGNVRPQGKIKGSLTQLDYPFGIAMDSAGNVYAANSGASIITVYAAGAEGNIAPIRIIAGSKTQLEEPTGIALDGKGRLYVVNNHGNSVTEYGANSNGNVRPLRDINGIQTMLNYPSGIALDSKSKIYVTNGTTSINVYAAGAKGNAGPQRVISGQLTQLAQPEGIAVDPAGYTYVANWDGGTMVVFAPGANGNVAPVRTESEPYLYAPDGVALDAQGKTYVSDGCSDNPNFVAVFAAGANNAPALRTIEGHKTRMTCATSILVR
jgi:sugar lactone lactonase YvrE